MKKTVLAALLLASFGMAHAVTPSMPVETQDRQPLSIFVEGHNGASFRLVYTIGHGWSFADHTGPRLASATSAQDPAGLMHALPIDTPQSVYVDGPTGYVFVYLLDEGWRFIGSVADTAR